MAQRRIRRPGNRIFLAEAILQKSHANNRAVLRSQEGNGIAFFAKLSKWAFPPPDKIDILKGFQLGYPFAG